MESKRTATPLIINNVYQESNENFPLISLFMNSYDVKAIKAVYAFLRIADNYADDKKTSQNEKETHLKRCEEQLKACYQHQANTPLFLELQESIERYQLPIEPFLKLLQSFRNDIYIKRYQTMDELLNQCALSAHPIGELILKIFQINDEELTPYVNSMCTAFQLIDHWQDIHEDALSDRVFIPLSLLNQFQIEKSHLITHPNQDNFVLLFNHLLQFTEEKLIHAKPLLHKITNKQLSFHCRLIWYSGMHLLAKMAKNKKTALEKKALLSRFDKMTIVVKALFSQLTH